MTKHLVKPTAFEPGKYITIFADASFCPDTKAWGYGFWVKWGAPAQTHVGHGGGAHCPGSLEAEVRALEAALEWITSECIPGDTKGKFIVVQSDCTGALARIQQKFGEFKYVTGAARVYTKHVKGHQGYKCARSSVNTLCDRKAGEHMRFYRAQHQKLRGASA